MSAGSLALLVTMLVIVVVARKLERSSITDREVLPDRSEEPHAASHPGGRQRPAGRSAASLGAALSALAAPSGDQRKAKEAAASPAKQAATILAFAVAFIALVVGIITGDG
jgi:hypothetical protein